MADNMKRYSLGGRLDVPSVESENQQERIAARRLRIAARVEARKRQELREEAQQMEEATAEVRGSQKQMEVSQKKMVEMINNSSEVMSNFLVAADAREVNRRSQLKEARRLREEMLKNEAQSSFWELEEIMEKCAEAKDTPELRDALKTQQQLCAQMIEDKNKITSALQRELRASDHRYVLNLKKQAEHLDLMREQIKEQMTSLMKLHRQELDLVNNLFEDEEKALHLSNREEWELKRKEIMDKQQKDLLQRMQQKEEYENQLHQLRVKNKNEYTMMKRTLETQANILQQNLQKTKATNFLNQEKLEYSRQVVGYCEIEKSQIESLQKKKSIKLNDTLKNLKVKCASLEKQSQEKKTALTDGYKRAMQKYKDMQKHSRHFAALSAKRFKEMRLMNEGEAKDLVHRALEKDRLIHEQILGLGWVRPPMPFMENSPIQPQRTTEQQFAMQTPEVETETEGESSTSESAGAVDHKAVGRLLELLCDEASFLIDGDLLKLLSPLEKDMQSAKKLEVIFSALGIESEEDVYQMAEFFVKYKQQQKDQQEETLMDSDLVHPNEVVKVLQAFTAQYRSRDVQSMEEQDDAGYWESMANVIPESKLQVWNALEDILKKYLTVLTDRSKLLTDTHRLEQENAKLRALLQ